MYQFDFSRLTPLDTYSFGYYITQYPVFVLALIANKTALFDPVTLNTEETNEALASCYTQLMEWFLQFAQPALFTAEDIANTDIKELFRRAVNGE